MNVRFFVLRYKDGRFVKRDDSTGPMSTGGYPFPVDTLDAATLFSSIEEAASYANICGWREFEEAVYSVELSLQDMIPYSAVWTSCNRHCTKTPESTSPDAQHYFNCAINHI